MDTLKSVGDSFKSGKGFFSFNGTLAGLGAPVIRPIAYKKINCKFYNLKYLKTQGLSDNSITAMLKPGSQVEQYKQKILNKDFKESFERTYYLKDEGYLNGFWFPIGLANNLTQYADAAKAALFRKLFIEDNIVSDIVMLVNDFLTLKPIIIRGESLKISSFIQKKKERLNSFEEVKEYDRKDDKKVRQTQKFYEYNDLEGKEYSFSVEMFTVMNNLWMYLLQIYLKQWTQTASKDATEINRKTAKSKAKKEEVRKAEIASREKSSIINFANKQFLQEKPFPNDKDCLFKTGNYLVYSYQNVYANETGSEADENDCISYLFDYYNDAFTLTNLKLSSYEINKNTNGDGLNINLQFDKTVACERVFNYDTLKTSTSGRGNKSKASGDVNEDKYLGNNEGKMCVKNNGATLSNGAKVCTPTQNMNQTFILR